MKLGDEFGMCNHCGEVFFKEDLINGKCKPCINGHEIITINAYNHTEDE